MGEGDAGEEMHVATVEIDDRPYDVSLAIAHDGIEYVGHLWFTDEAWEDAGVRDHGAIPGRDRREVLAHARALSATELALRFHRAQVDKRRHHGLRRVTEQILSNIRHLNHVATSMRAGLLAVDEAATEIDATERRLHAMIDELREYAGVAG